MIPTNLSGRLARMLHRALACATLTAACAAGPVAGQAIPWDYGELEVTRTELEGLLARFEGVVASPVYGGSLRDQASASAERIRDRLQNGDFGVGDRIVLKIQGETASSDTVLVEPGKVIVVTGMGRISVAGVLRSELQDHLVREIGRFIRDPIIETQSLLRLSIQGAVGRPGFYVVPATMLVEDVIMYAGGPAQNANLEAVKVERAGELLIESDIVQEAFTEGRSLDQLNLRAGDQLIVPAQATSSFWRGVGRYALLIGFPLFFGIRLF